MTGEHNKSEYATVLNRLKVRIFGRTPRKVAFLILLALFTLPHGDLKAAANPKYASVVINAYTGQVLYARNSASRRYPASLTKMMTLYLLFEQLEKGNLTLHSQLTVSRRAQNQTPTKLGLKVGQTISVEQAINALVIKSANDVATVVAENIGGTEVKFAQLMTQKAKTLGLKGTQFRNASGLPNRKQYTTARDMARLGQRLILDFPTYYSYFAATSFSWKGTTYKTHNNLLKRYRGTDGIKTGYIRASGFNLVSSVKRNGVHLIGVVFGGRKVKSRDAHMQQILDEQFKRVTIDPALGRRFVVIPKPMAKPGSGNIFVASSTSTPAPTVAEKPTSAAMSPVIEQGDTSYTGEPSSPSSSDPIGDLIEAQHEERTMAALEGKDPSPAENQLVASLSPPPLESLSFKARLTDPQAFYAIQIGAYRVRDIAVQRLNAAAARSTDLFRDVMMAIVPIDVNGTTIYRARIGPYRELEAVNTCSTLQQQGVTCFTIVQDDWSKYATN